MIQEQYVSFEVAKLLREKGFEIDTTKDYWKIGPDGTKYFMCSIGAYTSDIDNKTAYYIPAGSYPCPTQQMAMCWLREEKNTHIVLRISYFDLNTIKWYFDVYSLIDDKLSILVEQSEWHKVDLYDNYEEACEAAIQYCLENLI